MPVPVDSRPPSRTSNSGTPNRLTTTSRRGGRSTVRSPAVGLSTHHDNPSSAAAAAAATAKAITSNGGWDRRAEYDKGAAHPYHWAPHDDRRYYERYAREDPYRYGDPRVRPHPDSRYQYPVQYRYPRDPHPRHPRNGTNLVIGGPKPIHVPKPAAYPHETEHALKRSAVASVFRGKPGEDKSFHGEHLPDAPQKLLLSLRTPSSSEEKDVDVKVKNDFQSSPKTHSRRSSDPLMDIQKTPGGSDKSDSFGLAPSFTIFNQSFDSLGDVQLNMDSTLHADSFGLINSSSLVQDPTNQHLLEEKINKHTDTDETGGLPIGYSPVTQYRTPRQDGTMLLDGSDPATRSPTQVLNIYRSYSGFRGGPLDDSHLRMSVGSFGAPRYSGPYDPIGTPGYYRGHGGYHESGDFYAFLRKYREAFRECAFLLPSLKEALRNPEATEKSIDNESEKKVAEVSKFFGPTGVLMNTDPTEEDLVVARRRVESSVCAFGGNLSQSSRALNSPLYEVEKNEEVVAVTPNSSTTSPPRSTKRKYDESLASRYYENESRLSWEFEECPPIEGIDTASKKTDKSMQRGDEECDDRSPNPSRLSNGDDETYSYLSRTGDDDVSLAGSTSTQQKIKYRCKLCGKPKQNHVCKYEQSLARSIGIMVYPCVNAFTATEPGTVAPPLSEMNNFTDQKDIIMEASPGRSPERTYRSGASVASNKQVTPDSLRSTGGSQVRGSVHPESENRSLTKRRRFGLHTGESDVLFTEATELLSEQIRVVTSGCIVSPDAFKYPALPMPYAQRKRLSDNLFALSNEVPKLTDECAKVLREAREKDMWDLAVAELMTQVVIILYCRDGDHRFQGLRQYLLTLGIAC